MALPDAMVIAAVLSAVLSLRTNAIGIVNEAIIPIRV